MEELRTNAKQTLEESLHFWGILMEKWKRNKKWCELNKSDCGAWNKKKRKLCNQDNGLSGCIKIPVQLRIRKFFREMDNTFKKNQTRTARL